MPIAAPSSLVPLGDRGQVSLPELEAPVAFSNSSLPTWSSSLPTASSPPLISPSPPFEEKGFVSPPELEAPVASTNSFSPTTISSPRISSSAPTLPETNPGILPKETGCPQKGFPETTPEPAQVRLAGGQEESQAEPRAAPFGRRGDPSAQVRLTGAGVNRGSSEHRRRALAEFGTEDHWIYAENIKGLAEKSHHMRPGRFTSQGLARSASAKEFEEQNETAHQARLASGQSRTSVSPCQGKDAQGLPRPEVAIEAAAQAAIVNGVWMTDGSRHTVTQRMTGGPDLSTGLVAPREGRATLRVCYLFSGVQRKASIAQHLLELCRDEGIGLSVDEIDIHVGGAAHDLLSKEAQEDIIAKIEAGDYDVIILSPPCGSWSRAPWSNNAGPQPVRDQQHPWGFPQQKTNGDRRRLNEGNEFVHFTLRAINVAQGCKRRGRRVTCLLEHPEDLGRAPRGVPASIWQLEALRKAFAEFPFITVGGHQCQFEVDYAKPTRLLTDILSLVAFGFQGWPKFDSAFNYKGPLPSAPIYD